MNTLTEKRNLSLPIWAYPLVMGLPLFMGITVWYLVDKSNSEKLETKIETLINGSSIISYQSSFEENEANKIANPSFRKIGDTRLHYFLSDHAALVERDTTEKMVIQNSHALLAAIKVFSTLPVNVVIHLPKGYFYVCDFSWGDNFSNVFLQGSDNFSTAIDVVCGVEENGYFSEHFENFSGLKYNNDRNHDISKQSN